MEPMTGLGSVPEVALVDDASLDADLPFGSANFLAMLPLVFVEKQPWSCVQARLGLGFSGE